MDVSTTTVERLFDKRDPARFRERDLDRDLVEYLRDASEDLASRPRFRVVVWLEQQCQPREIEEAFRAHFEYEIERLVRVRRRHRRTGLVALAFAIVLIVVLLSLAQVVASLVGGSIGSALREAIVISCWVLMWRPIDELVYDWIPFRRERAVMQRLLDAPVDVRFGKGPPGEGSVRDAVEGSAKLGG